MEWNRGPIIGRGSSAAVYAATTSSGELLAVKSTKLSCSSFLQREQNILSRLNSPYIIKYLGSDIKCENNKPMYNVLMEYIPGGNLCDVIKRQGGSLDESTIRVYANQILQGLGYLHSNSIVHCDIKGQNILVGKSGVKIADLGCATLLENGVAATSEFSGTPVFMAPEVARGEEQGFPADIWALGCTIIEMATGSYPWPELNDPISAIHKIGFSGELPNFPIGLSDDGRDFLSKCLRIDAKERWTARQLLEHKFLVGLASDHYEKVVENFNSPTSVLDLGYWDSIETSSESSLSPTRLVCTSKYRAYERIRGLFASQVLPEWADSEDWITVRINPIEDNVQCDHDNIDRRPSTDHMELFDGTYLIEEQELIESFTDIQDLILLLQFTSDVVEFFIFNIHMTDSELSSVIQDVLMVSKYSNFVGEMNDDILLLIIINFVTAVHMHFTLITLYFLIFVFVSNIHDQWFYVFFFITNMAYSLTKLVSVLNILG